MQVSSAEVRPEVLQAGTWTGADYQGVKFWDSSKDFLHHWQAQKEMAELRCQLEVPCQLPTILVLVLVVGDVLNGNKQHGNLQLAAGELMARL